MNGIRGYLPFQTFFQKGFLSSAVTQQSLKLIHRNYHSTNIQQVEIPFKLTDIGPGIGHVEILRWFVHPGKHVNEYDPICEVQNEKATVDISSRFDGVIKKLNFKVGDQIQVGQAILDIDVPEEVAKRTEDIELREKAAENIMDNSNKDTNASSQSSDASDASLLHINTFHDSTNVQNDISQTSLNNNDKNSLSENTSTSTCSSLSESEESGCVSASTNINNDNTQSNMSMSNKNENDTLSIDNVHKSDIQEHTTEMNLSSSDESISSTMDSNELNSDSSSNDGLIATASVRDFAFENQINLKNIHGTGQKGRIMKEDVISYINRYKIPQETKTQTIIPDKPIITIQSAPLPQTMILPDRIETLHGLTKSMSRSMSQSLQIPHLGYMDDICMDQLLALKPQLAYLTEEYHVNISFVPFFIKALSLSLNEYPILNSTYIQEREEILYHGSHNIGIAIDTPRGLVVPNIKHCEIRSVVDIAIELHRIKILGKQNKLGREDLEDTTITFSNIGKVGGTYSSPVITPPQVCTGNLGQMKTELKYNNMHQVIESVIVPTSWNVDQRIIDGASLAKLVQGIKYYIENPFSMLAKMR